MNKSGMITIIVAVLFLVVGGFFVSNQQSQKAEQAKMAQEKAAMKAKEDLAMKQEKAAETEMMKKNEEVMAMAVKDSTSKKGNLVDVAGGTSFGTAYILRKDGKLYHAVSAKLPDLSLGFYEGWLVLKTQQNPVFFSTGKLLKDKDSNYTLSYSSDNLYKGYDFVVVTEEAVDDKKPEKHILEGTVK